METKPVYPRWSELLLTAVNEPGTLSAAYSAFHSYSMGNQLLAMSQCMTRKIKPGPIATFPAWIAKNRRVRKGEVGNPIPEKHAQRILKAADTILKAGQPQPE